MKLVDFRRILGNGCLVKIGFVDCDGWDFTGSMCDFDHRYDDHEVVNVYNIDDPFDYDPYLRIVME